MQLHIAEDVSGQSRQRATEEGGGGAGQQTWRRRRWGWGSRRWCCRPCPEAPAPWRLPTASTPSSPSSSGAPDFPLLHRPGLGLGFPLESTVPAQLSPSARCTICCLRQRQGAAAQESNQASKCLFFCRGSNFHRKTFIRSHCHIALRFEQCHDGGMGVHGWWGGAGRAGARRTCSCTPYSWWTGTSEPTMTATVTHDAAAVLPQDLAPTSCAPLQPS